MSKRRKGLLVMLLMSMVMLAGCGFATSKEEQGKEETMKSYQAFLENKRTVSLCDFQKKIGQRELAYTSSVEVTLKQLLMTVQEAFGTEVEEEAQLFLTAGAKKASLLLEITSFDTEACAVYVLIDELEEEKLQVRQIFCLPEEYDAYAIYDNGIISLVKTEEQGAYIGDTFLISSDGSSRLLYRTEELGNDGIDPSYFATELHCKMLAQTIEEYRNQDLRFYYEYDPQSQHINLSVFYDGIVDGVIKDNEGFIGQYQKKEPDENLTLLPVGKKSGMLEQILKANKLPKGQKIFEANDEKLLF